MSTRWNRGGALMGPWSSGKPASVLEKWELLIEPGRVVEFLGQPRRRAAPGELRPLPREVCLVVVPRGDRDLSEGSSLAAQEKLARMLEPHDAHEGLG